MCPAVSTTLAPAGRFAQKRRLEKAVLAIAVRNQDESALQGLRQIFSPHPLPCKPTMVWKNWRHEESLSGPSQSHEDCTKHQVFFSERTQCRDTP